MTQEHDPALDIPATAPDRRWYRKQVRFMLGLAVVAVLGTIVGGVIVDNRSANRVDDRDEATKYQRCTQSAAAVIETNRAVRFTRELGERNIRLYVALGDVVASSKTASDNEKFEFAEAARSVNRSLQQLGGEPQPVPDCAKLYERGFEVTRKIGIVIPTVHKEEPTTPPTTPEKTTPDK